MTLIPTLETPRFRLRAPERSDFEVYAAMWADARITQFIGGVPRDRTTSWSKYLAMRGLWPLLGYGYWLFTERESDALVGAGGLSWFDRGVAELEGYPEAGWAITPEWWGKGAASEIMAAALGWADRTLADAQVRCIIDPGNGASRRVAEKLGFAQIGSSDSLGHPVNVLARMRGTQ